MTGILALYLFLFADVRSARALLEQGKTAEALRELEAALRASPDDPEVQFQAGELLRALGAQRAARLQQLAPASPEAHELAGRSLESEGRLNEALDEYRAALRIDPGLAGVHFLAGNVLWKKREFDPARAELEAELRINPNHARANLRLGEVLLSLNDRGAIGYLRKAVEADVSLLEAHRELGKAYRLAGDHRAALNQFRIVADRQPTDEFVHAQLAGEYRSLGEADRAREEYAVHRRLLAAKAAAARQK